MLESLKFALKNFMCCGSNNSIVRRDHSRRGERIQVIDNTGHVIFYINENDLCKNCHYRISSSRSSSPS